MKIILLLFCCGVLAIWIKSRWRAWFYNPPEEPYVVQDKPDRVLLTFGNSGEFSRYISWICGSKLDHNARLILTDGSDSLFFQAVGEVFRSRSGEAAYYRAEITDLKPDKKYSYCVETLGQKSPWYNFKTTNPKSEQFTFLYIGDVQDTIGGISRKTIHNAITEHPEAEFLCFGGDLILRPTNRYWEDIFKSMDTLCSSIPIISIAGNHEYLKYFKRKCERRFSLVFPYFIKGMVERSDRNHLFSLSYHNTDFFLLDSSRGLGYLYDQRRWLKSQIAASKNTHRVAMVHHPIYSAKKRGNNMEVRMMFNDVLKSADVDLVLQGHEHIYTRCGYAGTSIEDGICYDKPLYVISHCSPKHYNARGRLSPLFSGSRYYQTITVAEDNISVNTYDAIDSKLLDSVVIKNKNQ